MDEYPRRKATWSEVVKAKEKGKPINHITEKRNNDETILTKLPENQGLRITNKNKNKA